MNKIKVGWEGEKGRVWGDRHDPVLITLKNKLRHQGGHLGGSSGIVAS